MISKLFFVLFLSANLISKGTSVQYGCSTIFPEGDNCRITSDNTIGVCKRASDCFQAFHNQTRPDLCMYLKNDVVICCPVDNQNAEDHDSDEEIPFSRPDFGIRVSQIKCQEYSKLAMRSSPVTFLVPDPIIFNVSNSRCDKITPLIVNGEKAKFGEFPHMAAVGYKSGQEDQPNFVCGGVLISEEFVLTAAHCVNYFGEMPSIVRLGGTKLKSSPEKYTDYGVRNVYQHPQYKKHTLYNDIGLIRLLKSVEFTEFIRPACLWQLEWIDNKIAVATGWGVTKFGGKRSNDLLKVPLNLFSSKDCKSLYKTHRKLPRGILDSQLCAGSRRDRQQDTCQGDSGGPIQVASTENQCVYFVLGITSFGKSCGSKTPGVYSRVSFYLDWIESIVWPNSVDY